MQDPEQPGLELFTNGAWRAVPAGCCLVTFGWCAQIRSNDRCALHSSSPCLAYASLVTCQQMTQHSSCALSLRWCWAHACLGHTCQKPCSCPAASRGIQVALYSLRWTALVKLKVYVRYILKR